MTSYGKAGRNNVNTIAFLRLLFACLTVGCIMQIAHDAGGILQCTPVYYVSDGDGSSSLRRHHPDAPLKNSNLNSRSLLSSRNSSWESPEPQWIAESRNGEGKTAEPQLDPIPKLVIDPLYQREQELIDNGIDDVSRCARYGVGVLPDELKHRRRIFFGSMLANENPEVLAAHAIEVHNKYDVIALVESNTTHSGLPRPMKYGPGSMAARYLTESEMFGTTRKTNVILDYWLEDLSHLQGMTREVEQRNTILKIWIDQGMTEGDVGIMADLDEIVSRDFLNAISVCDFPKMRYTPNERASCQTPKMLFSSVQFESSPLCIKKNEWHHPDLILGSCIKGIGDPSGRVTPERIESAPGRDAKVFGQRLLRWGLYDNKNFPQDVIDNDRFPLWDGRDIREVNGSNEPLTNYVDKYKMGHGTTAIFGTAYHLHNWFKDMKVLRHKFATYGHADHLAWTQSLSEFDGDINMLLRCARGLGNDNAHKGARGNEFYPYFDNNFLLPEGGDEIFSLGGNRPIYFKNRTYVEERHALVQEMIRADEEKWPGLGGGQSSITEAS